MKPIFYEYLSDRFLWYVVWSLFLIRITLAVLLRKHIRKKFNIGTNRGTMGSYEDIFCVCCCYDCVMCQQMSTMNKFEKEGILYPTTSMEHA